MQLESKDSSKPRFGSVLELYDGKYSMWFIITWQNILHMNYLQSAIGIIVKAVDKGRCNLHNLLCYHKNCRGGEYVYV